MKYFKYIPILAALYFSVLLHLFALDYAESTKDSVYPNLLFAGFLSVCICGIGFSVYKLIELQE